MALDHKGRAGSMTMKSSHHSQLGAIRRGRYLEIPDTGHLGFIEAPQVVNAAALKFFADTA
jgi:hypothetical protein